MAKAELALFPTPGTGHIVSAVEFAKLITKHDPRISILVIIFHTPINNSATVDSYIESTSREVDSNRITFLTLPPLVDSSLDPASNNFFHTVVELQKPLIRQAFEDRSKKPHAFVVDLMCVNFIDIAQEFEIPSYVYFTAGASLLSLMFHLQVLDDKGVDIAKEYGHPGAELDLPGFKDRVPANVLPMLIFEKDSGASKFFNDVARKFRETKGIIVNSFMELESCVIQSLHDQENVPEVYPVGPILSLDEGPRGGPREQEQDRDSIMQWLDEQPESSVVFLCFGSLGSFGAEQVKEIANGLERSGHHFLWSLRRPVSENKHVLPSENGTFEEALPEGFLARTAHRGKIIGWAPQVQILGHRAIGGFVSHCGWNSILESMWFGVPIGAWPLHSEQQLNAFQLVKVFDLAVEIKLDYRRNLMKEDANVIVTAKEVENGVNKLMSLDGTKKMKIQKMRNKSRKALESSGSSHICLTEFVEQVLLAKDASAKKVLYFN